MKAHIRKKIDQVKDKIERLQIKIHDRRRDIESDGKSYDKIVERWEMDMGALEEELEYWEWVEKGVM